MQLQVIGENERKEYKVCIPDHAKAKEQVERPDFTAIEQAEFYIDSVYNIGSTTMATGKVMRGEIRKGMHVAGTDILAEELMQLNRPVEKLERGEQGAIFFSKKAPKLSAETNLSLVGD